MRDVLLAIAGTAALTVCGSGVAAAADDDLPSFCSGTKEGKQAEITCTPPSQDMRWIGFARCTTPWHGGTATWWQRSGEVRGSQTVTIICNDEGAPEVRVDLLSWQEQI